MNAVTFEQAEGMVSARLGKKAAAHCRRVAEQADQLAAAYGVDRSSARLAGLLHDWDRQRTDAELLEAAAASGIDVSEAEAARPHLLHSRTGAEALAHLIPDLPADVVSAISRHTVGAPDMSELDMIVYIADMLEPEREYAGVEELRALVGEVSLAELFARCYQQSVQHLVSARKPIHPATVATWNALVAGGVR